MYNKKIAIPSLKIAKVICVLFCFAVLFSPALIAKDFCKKGDCKNGYGIWEKEKPKDRFTIKYEGSWSKSKRHGNGTEIVKTKEYPWPSTSTVAPVGKMRKFFWFFESFDLSKKLEDRLKKDKNNTISEMRSWIESSTWESESKYKGEWVKGKRHGKGKYTLKFLKNDNASILEAKGIKMTLLGDLKPIDKSFFAGKHYSITSTIEYDGSWKADKMNGDGILKVTFNNLINRTVKHIYKGAFKNGKAHGNGTFTTFWDGKIREKKEGIWKRGKFVDK